MTNWPADARAFSRPTSKAREKRPGDEVGLWPHSSSQLSYYFFIDYFSLPQLVNCLLKCNLKAV